MKKHIENVLKIIKKHTKFLNKSPKRTSPKNYFNDKIVPLEEKTFVSKRTKFKFFEKKLEFRDYSQDFFKDPKKIAVAGSIWFGLLIATFYTVFHSAYFAINNIDIVRWDSISSVELTFKAIEPYYGKSIFLTSSSTIEEKIKTLQENVKNVEIRRLYPNSITVTVNSYKPLFNAEITFPDGKVKNYTLLENGSLLTSKQVLNLPVIKIAYNWENKPTRFAYRKIYSDKIISIINDTYLELSTNYKDLEISDMVFYPIEREIQIGTNKWILIIDLFQSVKNQLLKYNYFKNEYTWPRVVYIDLRIKDRIDFCTVDTEYDCMLNLKEWYLYE